MEVAPPEPPNRRVPWLAILLLALFVFGGLAYVGIGPSRVSQVPPRPQPEATAAAVPSPTPQPATPSAQERIAASTDRAELLRIAQAAPALQEPVEARLRALGFVRVAGREQVYWLQPGGERFRECSDCPEMVIVPSGAFRMGSPATEADRQEDEDDRAGAGGAPVEVAIAAPFALARTEVTVGEFAAFVKATGRDMGGGCFARIAGRRLTPEFSWRDPGFPQTDDHPVPCVSHEDAVAYAAWLSEKTGGLYRLPSEPEWEYAARAGAGGRFAHGEADAELCRHANVADATAAQAFAGWVAAPCDDGAAYTSPQAPTGRTASACTTCTAISGNGWRTASRTASAISCRRSRPAGRGPTGSAGPARRASSGAAPGAIRPPAPAPPRGSRDRRGRGTGSSASASQGRSTSHADCGATSRPAA